jgi:hypothetical protein
MTVASDEDQVLRSGLVWRLLRQLTKRATTPTDLGLLLASPFPIAVEAVAYRRSGTRGSSP